MVLKISSNCKRLINFSPACLVKPVFHSGVCHVSLFSLRGPVTVTTVNRDDGRFMNLVVILTLA